MRRSIMAIMDRETVYAVHFMDHVNQKNTVPFEVQAFTDLESLRQCLEKRRVEILLVSEGFSGNGSLAEDSGENAFRQRLNSWPIRLIVELGETAEQPGGGDTDAFSEEAETEGDGPSARWPRVCKYQASSEIIREVMELYSKSGDRTGSNGKETLIKPRTKTIGVFSPVGRVMKTSLAVTIGQHLAGKRPTLLINMEACSGLGKLFSCEGERGISDILYYIRQGEKNLIPRILPVVREFRGLGYLPPFESAAELFGMTPGEWNTLLSAIRSASTYEDMVIDFGVIPLMIPEILEECDVIYMPEKGYDTPQAAKMEEFMNLISSSSFLQVRERIRRITMPETSPELQSDWFSAMLYGPVGRIAGECIRRDNL